MSAFKPLPGAQLNLDHPLARGLVGSWIMNEGSGKTVHDYSGQGNAGTIIGMNDPPIATSGWNAGPHGGALAFDGVNDHVNISRIPITTSCTLFGFVQLPTLSGYRTLFGTSNETANYPLMLSPAENKVFAGAASQQYWPYVFNNNLHMYCTVYDGAGNTTLFIDAINQGTKTFTPKSILFLGQQDVVGGFPMNGLISSASIYNRALSAEEIAYLYAFPYCMFDEPAYPAWMRKHISAQDYYRHLLAGSGY